MVTPPPLWTLPLAGTPCSVCFRAATHLAIYPNRRVIHHVHGGGCQVASPGGRLDSGMTTTRPRAVCPGCGRSIAMQLDGNLRAHIRRDADGNPIDLCPGTRRTPDQPVGSREAVAA